MRTSLCRGAHSATGYARRQPCSPRVEQPPAQRAAFARVDRRCVAGRDAIPSAGAPVGMGRGGTMQPKDLLRHAPLVRVQDALTRYNAIRNTNLTMTSPVSPMTFAEIVHLMDQDAFHGLPSGLQGST